MTGVICNMRHGVNCSNDIYLWIILNVTRIVPCIITLHNRYCAAETFASRNKKCQIVTFSPDNLPNTLLQLTLCWGKL